MRRPSKPIKLLLSLFIATLAACGPAATPLPPTSTAIPPTHTPAPTALPAATAVDIQTLRPQLDALFQQVTQAGSFSGAVLVAHNGQIILSNGYGFADRAQKIPITAHTKFRIASLTKTFTAMAIMMLQEQGKLNVQDKLCQYLTDCPEAWKPITLRHLLTHTSGIPDTYVAFHTQAITSSVGLEQEIADAKSRPLDFPPGEKFSYDNLGYIVLGKIIEAVSGQPYADFLRQHIFEPLQMSNTGFDPNRSDLALGYNDLVQAADPVNLWFAFSAAGLYSTVEDLYRWDQALYTNQLVPQTVLDSMFATYVSMPDTGGWGYGYGWMTGPAGERRVIGHGGDIEGFISLINRYPDDKATIIILTNQHDDDPYAQSDLVAAKLFGK